MDNGHMGNTPIPLNKQTDKEKTLPSHNFMGEVKRLFKPAISCVRGKDVAMYITNKTHLTDRVLK